MRLRLFIFLLFVSFSAFGQRALFFTSTIQEAPVGAPTTQAHTIVASDVGRNELTLSLTRGNGEAVLVVARLGEPVTDFPIDGQSYTASSTFGEGDEVGIGNFVIHNGDGTIGTISGLSPEDDIYIRAFERNGTKYNTDPAVDNPISQELPAFPLGVFANIATDFEDWTFASASNGAEFVSGINHGSWGDVLIGHTNAPTLDTSKEAMRLTRADGEGIKFAKPVNFSNPFEYMMVMEVISSSTLRNIAQGSTSENTVAHTWIATNDHLTINNVDTGVIITEGVKFAMRVHLESGTNNSYVQINKGSKVFFSSTVNNGNGMWFGTKQSTTNSMDGWLWAVGQNQGTVADADWESIVDFYIP